MEPKDPMYVYRLHIRPKGGRGDAAFAFAYCLDNQVLGVGWLIYSDVPIATWEDYEREALKEHDDIARVRYLKRWVKKDDLIWTRCSEGNYYLARVTSP